MDVIDLSHIPFTEVGESAVSLPQAAVPGQVVITLYSLLASWQERKSWIQNAYFFK